MACHEPMAIANRLPPEILLEIFSNVYEGVVDDHSDPKSTIFCPRFGLQVTADETTPQSSPSARLVPLLTVCKSWTRIALEVLYREPRVALAACGQLAQTLSLGGMAVGQGTNVLGGKQSHRWKQSGSGVGYADSSTMAISHSPVVGWQQPSPSRQRRPQGNKGVQQEEEERSPYYGMDWYWDPAGGCAQCRQVKRAQQLQLRHPQPVRDSVGLPSTTASRPSPPTSSSPSSFSSHHSSGSSLSSPSVSRPATLSSTTQRSPQTQPTLSSLARPLPIDYTRLIKKPCRVMGSALIEKQDLIQLWDLQRVLAYASKTQLEDFPLSLKKKKKNTMSQSTAKEDQQPLPVLMVLDVSSRFRETTDYVLKNVVGLGVRQLHYNNNQPVPLVDLVQEHGSTMQELHLKQVDLTVDEYVQLAQMLGLAQGEVKLGYQGRGTTKDDDEEDNDEGIRQDRRHHHLRRPRDSRTRLRSITFENCRNALRRSVLEALAEHCGSGLEHLELHGMSRGRPLGWPTVAALEPYPIPTEHSLSVLGSATISMYRKTDLGLSSMLKKCGLTPVQALGQDDQAMLQHWMKNKSLRKEQGNKQAPVAGGDAQAEHHQEYDPTQLEAYINSLDPEARLGEALVELGRLAPRLTSLKISMADGLWDGCLDLFRHPDQADSSDRGPLSPWQPLKRPFLSRSDSAYASSSSMSISPPLSPSPVIGSWTPSSPSISSGSVTPLPPAAEDQNDEDDSSIKTPSKTSVWRGRVNPSRKCSLQELVLIRCGLKSEENPNGSRLTIPGLVKVCGPDLETLVVDRETCWRPDHTDGSLPSECFTATGDQILGGLLASEQQKSTQTKMTSLKHLLLMDHWVSVPMIKRAFDAWSFHLKAVQFLVLPCTLETLLDALSPSCDNPALEVLMLSIVHESDLAALWSLKPEEVRVFLPTVFGRFPQLRVVRLTHSGATWTRTEWEAFCSLESANTTV